LIIGTSSWSLIAAALSIGHPIDEIASLFEDVAGRIFKRRWIGSLGLVAPRYNKIAFHDVVQNVFGSRLMADARTLLLITATNIETGDAHLFISRNERIENTNVEDTSKVPMVDAILASCAAPTFFAPHRIGDHLYVDGGLWANNPSLVGLLGAVMRLNWSFENVSMLSIGTGEGQSPYMYKKRLPVFWGLLTGVGLIRPYDLMLGLQSSGFGRVPSIALQPGRYLRLNFEMRDKLRLDSKHVIPDLSRKADEIFETEREAIDAFVRTAGLVSQPDKELLSGSVST
jgi:uncharacterized protein